MTSSRLNRSLLSLLPLLLFTTTLLAQQEATVRDLFAVPEATLQALDQAGADLTQTFMDSALTAHLVGDTTEYLITAVVLTDVLNSGLANLTDGRVDRVHIFVRDTAAASQGNEGMTVQIVDGAYEDNSTLDLIPGDVIEMTGKIDFFTNSVEFAPNSFVVLGSYSDLGLPESIMLPDTATTDQINKSVGDGLFQANWLNYNIYSRAYVCVVDATVLDRTVSSSRPDWSITSDFGATALLTYDASLRYRNDRDDYPAPFNVRTDDFVPPSRGATVDVCGTMIHQPFNDPYLQATPTDAMLSIIPWSDSDLTIKESPPSFAGALSTPDVLQPSSDPYTMRADVLIDPLREATGVTLFWVGYGPEGLGKNAQADTNEVTMVNTEGTFWDGEIPAQGVDRSFVVAWAMAEDNVGATSTSDPVSYRVFDSPVASISDLQQSVLPGPSNDYPSPLAGLTLDLNLTVTVQSQPAVSVNSGAPFWVIVQDDPDVGPWSGIMLAVDGAGMNQGDEIVIESATVHEQFGVTQLTDPVMGEPTGKVNAMIPYRDMATADLLDRLDAESYENIMVNFPDVTIIDNERFGEWSFTNGTEEEDVLGDGASNSFPDDNSVFQAGEQYEFLRGAWWYSFGTYKLIPEDLNDVGGKLGSAIERVGDVPSEFSLNQNYPNPFNPTTMITYDLPNPGRVQLEVFDITGKKVATLVDEEMSAGSYRVSFDANGLASGVYMYRLAFGDHVQTNKMLLMR